MSAVVSSTQKIERTFVSKGKSLGPLVRVASAVAPRAVEAYAALRFATPARRESTPAPEIPGIPARAFTAGRRGAIAAWAWGEGPTVLLAHGWNGLAAQLRGFVAPLVAAGYRVVAFDQPAHGRSQGRTATLVDMAEAVRAVADAAQVPGYAPIDAPIHAIIAHSLGAAASAIAMRDGLTVERAVFLASPAEPSYFARGFAARLGLPPALADGVVRRIRDRVGADLASFDVRLFAPRMRASLLVMHDPKDREVPFEHARSIAEAWPGARLVPLERAGHTRMLAIDEVIDRAVAFVREEHEELRGDRDDRGADVKLT